MEPGQGFNDVEDTMELVRDAQRGGRMNGPNGTMTEALTTTERTQATAQAALQPFSYDLHVKLGMELLALRRQEKLMALDAEAFGEKLKRRAMMRDVLKQVAKDENWVQYPTSDLERYRALGDGVAGNEEEEEGDNPDKRGSREPSAAYAKWLERRRRGAERRAAFGTTAARDVWLYSNGQTRPSDTGPSARASRSGDSFGPGSGGSYVFSRAARFPLQPPASVPPRRSSSSTNTHTRSERTATDGSATVTTVTIDGSLVTTNTAGEATDAQQPAGSSPSNEPGAQRTRQRPRASFAGDVLDEEEWRAQKRLSRAGGGDGGNEDGGGGRALGVEDYEAFAAEDSEDDVDAGAKGRRQPRAGGVTEEDLDYAAAMLGLGGGEGLRHVDMARAAGGGRRDSVLAGSFGGLRGARAGQGVLFKMKTGLVAAAADSAVGSFSLGLPLPAMPLQRAKSVHHAGGGGGGFNWREAMRTRSMAGSSMMSSQLATASGEVQDAGGSLAGLLSDLGLSGGDTTREQKAQQHQKPVDTARYVLALEEAVRSVSAITDDQLLAFVKAVQATQAAALAAAKAAAVEAASAPPPRTPPPASPRTPASGGEADGAPDARTALAQDQVQEQRGQQGTTVPLEGSEGPGAEQGDTEEARAARAVEVAAARAAATSAAAASAAAHVSVMMYAEAAAAVDSLAVAAEDELDYAVDEYASAHGRRMKAIVALQDRDAETERLQAWRAEEEQARVVAVVAALQQQCERIKRIAAPGQEGKAKGKGKAEAAAEKDGEEGEEEGQEEGQEEEKEAPSSASPAVAQLSQRCAAAVELLTALRESITEAEQMAGLREMERERRREALRLIEEECVRLAEEMAAQEETERLAAVMAAEAEAERLMEAAETEEEVKRHALMAAILMGVEEWVLEKEARQAALRAAERDESRLRALVGAEVDKARQAAEEGAPPPTGELLAELRELHGQAADELALRRRLYNEAVEELVRLEALRQAELDKAALREHGEAEGAAAAAAVRAMAAESAIDHVEVPETKADEEEGDVEALLAAAVRAVEGFCGVAERRQGGAGTEAGTEAGAGAANSSTVSVELEQNGEGKGGEGEKEDELQRWSREAKERLAAACAALSAVRALREQMQVTSAELADMKQEVAAEAEARAAVAEEQRRVAALAAAEADSRRQAWLQEVLDECNRLYDLLVAGEAAEAPEPQESEQPPPEATVEPPEQPEVQVPEPLPPPPPPPAPVAGPTKAKALGGPATVTLGFDSAPGRSTVHVPTANPLHRHYQHQHQQLHNALGAAFLVQNSRALPYGKAPNAPPVLASLQTHGLPPAGQDAAGVLGHASTGIASSPSGHSPSGMAGQRRSYIAHGMHPSQTHVPGPHGEHMLPPISAHALLPVGPASPLPGPVDPLRPGSGGGLRPGRASPRAGLAADDLLYSGASEGSQERHSPVTLQGPAAATAGLALSAPSPGRGGGLLSPHSSSVRPSSGRAVSMQVLVPRLPQCGTAHESPMHQQLLRRQQQQQQHGEDPSFILEPSHSYSASNTPTRHQAHPPLGRRSQPGTLPAASNASGGGFSLPTLPLNMSYSQWVAQHDASARALEAARQVDEVLSRLPPELHSVLLGAADLLQGVNAAVQLKAQEPVEGPSQLAALPPVVAKYIMGQLQRIYQGPKQQPGPQQQLQDAGEGREGEQQQALQQIQQHGGLTASPSTLQVLGSCLPGVAHSLAAVKGRLPGGHLPAGLCLDAHATPGALGFQGGALRSRKAGSADPSKAHGGKGRLRRVGSGGKGGGAARAEYELLKAQHDALGVERWTLRGVNVQLPRQGGGAAGGGPGAGLSALSGLSGFSGTYPQHRDAFLPPLNSKTRG